MSDQLKPDQQLSYKRYFIERQILVQNFPEWIKENLLVSILRDDCNIKDGSISLADRAVIERLSEFILGASIRDMGDHDLLDGLCFCDRLPCKTIRQSLRADQRVCLV